MESNKKPWPLLSVCNIKDRIDATPDYQRPAVWSLSQKQLLIDTILRGYAVQGRQAEIAKWFLGFEQYRREQHELAVDLCDPEIVIYQEKTSHSTDSADSLEWRHT